MKPVTLKIIFPIICFLIIISSAKASVYSVCSSGCNFNSIQAAINGVSNGDEVRITDSREYNETLNIDKSIILAGYLGACYASCIPTIFPTVFFAGNSSTINITADNVAISNLKIKYNGTNSSRFPIEVRSRNNITITNNIILNFGTFNDAGIYFSATNSSRRSAIQKRVALWALDSERTTWELHKDGK